MIPIYGEIFLHRSLRNRQKASRNRDLAVLKRHTQNVKIHTHVHVVSKREAFRDLL